MQAEGATLQIRRHDATRETALSGTAAELSALAASMRDGSVSITLDVAGDPAPYSRMLSSLAVARTDGPVVIERREAVLHIRGGAAQLDVLAANIQDFAAEEGDAGSHLHIEYFPGHGYLDETSEALVVQFLRGGV
jgi:hypothetical protein